MLGSNPAYDALLDALEAEVLRPDVVEQGLGEALAELERHADTMDPARAAARPRKSAGRFFTIARR